MIATGSRDGLVKIMSLNGTTITSVSQHDYHDGFVNSVAFYKDTTSGKLYLASGGMDGIINVYDVFDKTMVTCIPAHSSNICYISWVAGGLIISCSWDKTYKLWSMDKLLLSNDRHSEAVWACVCPSAGLFLSGMQS